MTKKTILMAWTAGLLFLSCSPMNEQKSEARVAETKKSALVIIQPVIDRYLEEGKVSLAGYYPEDLGDGTMADLPDLAFVSEDAETSFYSECGILLKQTLQDDFSDICEVSTLEPESGQGRYTTYCSQNLNMGGELGYAKIKIVRYWVIKYFISFEVTGLNSPCGYMKISLSTNLGDTKTLTNQYGKEIKLHSKAYSSSNNGSHLKPTYASLEYLDVDFDFNQTDGFIEFIK